MWQIVYITLGLMYVEFHYYYFENKKYQQNEFKRLYEELQKKSST